MIWQVITDFGDSAAMMPVAMALCAWLIINGRLHAAALWIGLLGSEIALVAVGKIAFLGWGIGVPALNFTGISGHSTLAASVIPIAAGLFTERASLRVRRGFVGLGTAVALTIAVSRVAIGVHSWSEVIAGFSLGTLVTWLFLRFVPPQSERSLMPTPMVAAILLTVAVLAHGTHAPSEYLIRRIALHLSGRAVPYARTPLQPGLFSHDWGQSADRLVPPEQLGVSVGLA